MYIYIYICKEQMEQYAYLCSFYLENRPCLFWLNIELGGKEMESKEWGRRIAESEIWIFLMWYYVSPFLLLLLLPFPLYPPLSRSSPCLLRESQILVWINHVVNMNESHRNYKCLLANIWMSHVSYMNHSCHDRSCVSLAPNLIPKAIFTLCRSAIIGRPATVWHKVKGTKMGIYHPRKKESGK